MKNFYPVIGLIFIAWIISLSSENMFLPGVLILIGVFYFFFVFMKNKNQHKEKCEDGG